MTSELVMAAQLECNILSICPEDFETDLLQPIIGGKNYITLNFRLNYETYAICNCWSLSPPIDRGIILPLTRLAMKLLARLAMKPLALASDEALR